MSLSFALRLKPRKAVEPVQQTNPDRGATLVEAALVLPIVLLLTFGVVEFGRFLAMSQGVSTAAREAARYGIAAGPSVNGIPRYTDCNEIEEAGKRLSGLGAVVDSHFAISYENDAGTVVADCDPTTIPPNPSAALIEDGDRVVVMVSRPFGALTPFMNLFLPTTVSASDQRTIFLVTS